MNKAAIYAEITKSEKQDDGSLLVHGIATDSTLDIDKQICDPAWLKQAMPRWFKWGNVREMHSNVAAGVATEYEEKDGQHHITALVVNPGSVLKVEKKVLKGFSIGIRDVELRKDAAAPNGVIAGGEIVEVSLVDRPANPACTLTLAKSATAGMEDLDPEDWDEATGTIRVEELTGDDAAEADGEAEPAPAGDTTPVAAPAVAGADAGTPDVEETAQEAPGGDSEGEPEGDAGGEVLADAADSHRGDGTAGDAGTEDGKSVDAIVARVLAELGKRDYSPEKRKEMAQRGQAMSGGGFPIKTVADLKNAIRAVGRAKDPTAARAHIMTRAKALGREDLVPASWGSGKAAGSDEMAHDVDTLLAVRNGLLNLIVAEAQEAMMGEREVEDIDNLLQALALFLLWWDGESYEGEAPAQADTKAADAVKAMTNAPPGTPVDTEKSEVGPAHPAHDAPAPAGGTPGDAEKATAAEAIKAAIDEAMAPLVARLAQVEKQAAPGGPARARNQQDTVRADKADALRVDILKLTGTASQISDPALRGEYEKDIAAKKAALAALGQ